MKQCVVNKEKLDNFFEYIVDKVDDCYKKEVECAIRDFVKEEVLEYSKDLFI